ncbi:predicted protein [Methanosarcina acetivorans C2A]|uniref:Transmembrane protein n=1 Tax=Methanosarcina acetivorans (strain ATCC 35395 / DSM 2834 / JCM 12185 / C2A) TaxID=188937 RepID=Q8TUR1_METAC|nr:predicted protein [Methanosarcina acetivorans C2A]
MLSIFLVSYVGQVFCINKFCAVKVVLAKSTFAKQDYFCRHYFCLQSCQLQHSVGSYVQRRVFQRGILILKFYNMLFILWNIIIWSSSILSCYPDIKNSSFYFSTFNKYIKNIIIFAPFFKKSLQK